jgi:hypothetical protein
MSDGLVCGIYVAPTAGAPMEERQEVFAEAGNGLVGDRYMDGKGSWNKGRQGKRQVTLMNALFFPGSGFDFGDSRRNLFIDGAKLELMWLIGQDFTVGGARLRGVKYCDPCERPSKLAGTRRSFQRAFLDRGCLIAEVLESGIIRLGSALVPPPKGY